MKNLIGIDEYKDVIMGVLVFICLFFARQFGFFSLTLPPFGSFVDSFGSFIGGIANLLIYVVIIPIVEAYLFRVVLLDFFDDLLNNFMLGNLTQSLFFAVLHGVAYTGKELLSITLQDIIPLTGAFLSAFMFAFIMGFFVKKYNNIIIEFVNHPALNFLSGLSSGLFSVV